MSASSADLIIIRLLCLSDNALLFRLSKHPRLAVIAIRGWNDAVVETIQQII